MKSIIRFVVFLFPACIFLFFSCSDEMPWEREQYEKLIGVLSDRSTQIYEREYHYDGSTGEKTISFFASGTYPVDQDVIIKVREDTILFDRYNRLNFDLDESRYAKKLVEGSMFTFASKQVTLKAGELDVQLPIHIPQETIARISPDSIYLIPVAIDDISVYDINPENYNMLFRVYARNDYASQLIYTTYRVRGKRDLGDEVGEREISGDGKVFEPVSANEVRAFAGVVVYDNSADKIRQTAMIIRVNDDLSLSLRPFYEEESGLIVEQLDPALITDSQDRIYDNMYDPVNKRFKMYYRYKIWTVFNEGKDNEYYDYSDWVTMKEMSILTTDLD